MNNIFGIIAAIFLFLLLITIHEGGHFIGAKLSGIKVNEFSVGMGPAIYKKQGEETLYSLRALPIGGYVMMEGEETSSSDPRSYENSAPWKRFLTIFAGPFTNFLFAFLVFLAIATFSGYASNEIGDISPNSPAQAAGLQVGDKIIEVNGKKTHIFSQAANEINTSQGQVELIIERDDSEMTLNVTPIQQEDRNIIGVLSQTKNDFLGAISYSWHYMIYSSKMILTGLVGLFTGLFGLNNLSGPIGVINQVSQSVGYGLLTFLSFGAIISLNLGLFNLIPIPALDGSKLVFILYEMISGKPVNKKFEHTITVVGFMALLGLILVVSINDVINLF